MAGDIDAATVLNEGMWIEGAVPASAILIVSGLNPDDGEENMFIRRDTSTPIWKHIGMLTVVLDDLRKACADEEDTD